MFFSYGVYAMGVKQCLFSEMSGVVNFEGKPAAGVKLVRMVDYNKPEYDETVTDEDGKFHFPVIYRTNLIGKFLPMQFVVSQEIVAFKDNAEYTIWRTTTTASTENYESRGKPLVVDCELSLKEENVISIDRNIIFSRCTWDVEADPAIDTSIYFEDDDDDSYLDDDIKPASQNKDF